MAMHGNALPAVSSQNCSRNLITATHRRGDRGRDQVNSACCRSSSRRARCRSACRCDSICALARLSTICRFGWLSFCRKHALQLQQHHQEIASLPASDWSVASCRSPVQHHAGQSARQGGSNEAAAECQNHQKR